MPAPIFIIRMMPLFGLDAQSMASGSTPAVILLSWAFCLAAFASPL